MSSIKAYMAWNRGMFCKSLQITHNYLIYLFYHFILFTFSSFLGSHRFYYICSMFSGVIGEVFCEIFLTIEEATSWIRGISCKFQKYSQQHNILVLLSFFGSTFHHLKVHRVDSWLIHGYFDSWVSFFGWVGVGNWYSYGLKQGNTLKRFTTHSQQPNILIWAYFFLNLLII